MIDVLRVPTDQWAASRPSQTVWAIVVLLATPILGALLYLVIARPKLVAVRTAAGS
ncbi:MAG: PLDc N-terminal domain-containing protein [Acidimicrobiia bacterium]